MNRWPFQIQKILFMTCLLALGCQRPEKTESQITIVIPSDLQLMKTSNKDGVLADLSSPLECFAISITGSDINTNTRACGPQTGIVSGFSPSGGTLSLIVPKGDNRAITVFMYLAPIGTTTCPHWDPLFEGTLNGNFKNTYKLQELKGYSFSKDSENITLTVGAPASLDNDILSELGQAQICQPKLSGYLTTTGAIMTMDGLEMANLSHPIHQSIGLITQADYSLSSFIALSSGQLLFMPNTVIEVPFYFKSIIRHPLNTNNIIGLREDGHLEEISLSTGIGSEMTSASCIFASCQIPPWIRSITLGFDQKLYGLDHSGKLYLFSSNEPQIVPGYSIPSYVEQVIF